MDLSPEKRRQLSRWIIGIAAACILLYVGVQNIGVLAAVADWVTDLVMPLLIGVFFAMILNVPMRFFEAHLWPQTIKPLLLKLRRPVAFVISLVLIIGILFGVIRLVIPELIDAITVAVQSAITFINELSAMDPAKLAEMPLGNLLLEADWNGLLTSLQSWLKEQSGVIVGTAVDTISSLVGGIIDFFIAFVFAVYVLFSKDKLKRQACRLIRAWLPSNAGGWIIHAAGVANGIFRNFVSGQTLEALILGVLCMGGMLILGLPYAPMIGALVGVTALVPIVGAFIGAIVGAFMIMTVDPLEALIFLIFLIILQQLEENLIYPRVMGSRVNLPALWILASVTVGGGIAGPVGMLLAVPIMSTAYVLLREATEQRERKRSSRP